MYGEATIATLPPLLVKGGPEIYPVLGYYECCTWQHQHGAPLLDANEFAEHGFLTELPNLSAAEESRLSRTTTGKKALHNLAFTERMALNRFRRIANLRCAITYKSEG